jgi:DNA mismatch endonuclease (patch repair protein)
LFKRERVVVFVDGCFWHGCPKCYRAPKAHSEYWSMKVRRNMERDTRITAECRSAGWRVVRLWEHEVLRALPRALAKVERMLLRPAARRNG